MSRRVSSQAQTSLAPESGSSTLPAQANGSAAQESLSVLLVTAGYDHTIRFWEAWSGICNRTIQHPESQVNRLAISPDKRFLAAAGSQHVKLYDVQHAGSTSNPASSAMASFDGHTGNITALAWHAEGKWIVTGSEDGTLKIWDTRTASVQRNFDHKAPVNDCVIHPNQGELISCDQVGAVKVWDLGANLCTHELVPEEEVVPMRSVTIASDGSKLIAGNNKGRCFVWTMQSTRDQTDPQPKTHFYAHDRYITRVLLSPDINHLATCSADTLIKVWNIDGADAVCEKVLQGHQRWVWDMAFSADSAYLVSASSDHTARLWELSTGQMVRQYSGHSKPAVCVALNDTA